MKAPRQEAGPKADRVSDINPAPEADDNAVDESQQEESVSSQPKEIGGRDGPDPTRYGDWEKAGRCIDF